ncbi:MAG: restriction endonuclease, partial [Candidatus Saccharimonadales bacterium]
MSGTDFEKYLADVFRKAGYAVEHVGRSGDHGADLIIEKDAIRTAVQAKRQKDSVG